jgi:hypothetical protein
VQLNRNRNFVHIDGRCNSFHSVVADLVEVNEVPICSFGVMPFPSILPEALKMGDLQDLSPQEEKNWEKIFLGFLAGVSARGMGRPMILKSPTRLSCYNLAQAAAGFAFCAHRTRPLDKLRIGRAHVANNV